MALTKSEQEALNHDRLEAAEFREEIRGAVHELQSQHKAMLDAIGTPSADGKGGTGLLGELLRLKADVRGLLDLKTKGMGFVAAIVVFGTIIITGIKGWLTNLLSGAHTG